jgi:membrane fusion protein, heavy metal efflux system
MKLPFRITKKWTIACAIMVIAGVIFFFRDHWLPAANRLIGSRAADAQEEHGAENDPDAHNHLAESGHAPDEVSAHTEGQTEGSEGADHQHDAAAVMTLSKQAEANIGLRLAKVEVDSFEQSIVVPAMVVERPGRCEVQVAAPLTGVVTRIWPLQGETVTPGQPLFDLRLTHEEVVEGQTQLLRTTEELDVVRREIARLQKVTDEGAIAGKTLLERKYEQQKLEGLLRAQRQGLLLHGLSDSQIDEIISQRKLVSEMTVRVPDQNEEGTTDGPRLLQIEELKVNQGQHVKVGDPLCTLADHTRLYIQGKAFEQDVPVLSRVAVRDWKLTAIISANTPERQSVPDLQIAYLANRIEPDSRAFLFYVELPNQLLGTQQRADGHRFSSWRFKPGERVDLLVPVEQWTDRIVLPLDAVVRDGAESYVFEKNDGHFDRRAVRVEYRDQYSAVIANDGSLTPGKMVVVSGAYQVHLAMKNAGGGPDPHAGHMH